MQSTVDWHAFVGFQLSVVDLLRSAEVARNPCLLGPGTSRSRCPRRPGCLPVPLSWLRILPWSWPGRHTNSGNSMSHRRSGELAQVEPVSPKPDAPKKLPMAAAAAAAATMAARTQTSLWLSLHFFPHCAHRQNLPRYCHA